MDTIQTAFSNRFGEIFEVSDIALINDLFIKNENKDLLAEFFKNFNQPPKEVVKLNFKIISFTEEIRDYLYKRYKKDLKIGNWGFRNGHGRVVPPEGHVHVRDIIYFTSITTILGNGPWYEYEGKRYFSEAGETTFFSEEYFLEQYPEYSLKPVLHGSPENTNDRLIFLCSFLPSDV